MLDRNDIINQLNDIVCSIEAESLDASDARDMLLSLVDYMYCEEFGVVEDDEEDCDGDCDQCDECTSKHKEE